MDLFAYDEEHDAPAAKPDRRIGVRYRWLCSDIYAYEVRVSLLAGQP